MFCFVRYWLKDRTDTAGKQTPMRYKPSIGLFLAQLFNQDFIGKRHTVLYKHYLLTYPLYPRVAHKATLSFIHLLRS